MDYFKFDLQLFADPVLKTIDLSGVQGATYDPDKPVVYIKNDTGTISVFVESADYTLDPDKEMRIGTIADGGAITLNIKGGADYDERETIAVAIYAFCGFSVDSITAGNRISFKIADGKTLDGVVSDFFVENVAGVRICVDGITDPNTAAARSVAIAADGTLTLSEETDSVQIAKGDAKIAATATTPKVFMNDLYGSTTDLGTLYEQLKTAGAIDGTASITYTNEGASPVAVAYQGKDGEKTYTISAKVEDTPGSTKFSSAAENDPKDNVLAIAPQAGSVTVPGQDGVLIDTAIGDVENYNGSVPLTVPKDGVFTAEGIPNGADFGIALDDGKKVTIGGKDYTKATNGTKTVVDVTQTGTTPTVLLREGEINIAKETALATGIGTVKNTGDAVLKVTDTAGTVAYGDGTTNKYSIAIDPGATATILGGEYKNPSTNGAATVLVDETATAGSKVTLNSGYLTIKAGTAAAVVKVGSVVITSTNTSKAITVNGDGVISAVEAGAEYNIALGEKTAVTIGGTEYYAAAPATITVDNAGIMSLGNNETIRVTGPSAVITTDIGTVQNQGTAALEIGEDGTLAPDSGAIYSVVVTKDQFVTIGSVAYTAIDANATLDVNNGVVTLGTGGKVSFNAQNASIVTAIGTITYTSDITEAGNGITVAADGAVSGMDAGDAYTALLAAGETLTGSGYTNASKTATATLSVTGTAAGTKYELTAGSISFDESKSFTVNGATISNDSTASGHPITIDLQGNVSQIAPGAKFSVTTDATKFDYEMQGTTLVKTGAGVGVYTTNGAASVTPNGTVNGGTVKAVTLTLDDDNADVGKKGTDTVRYYALLPDGSVAVTPYVDVAAAIAAHDDAIGCFKAVTSWADTEGATPAVTVTFVGNLENETALPTSYLGNVTVDMTNVQKVTINGDAATATNLGSLVVTGISGAQTGDGDIFIVGLNKATPAPAGVGGVSNLPDPPTGPSPVVFDKDWAEKLNKKDDATDKIFIGYGVYASIGEEDYTWFETVEAVKTEAKKTGDDYVIGASFEKGVLTVANGGTGRMVTIGDIENPTAYPKAENLKGVSIQVVESFDADGTATIGDGTGIVYFGTDEEAGIAVTATLGESFTFDGTKALMATIPTGATVVSDGRTYTANADSIMQLTITGAGVATLYDGNVTVSEDEALQVGANTYEAKGADAQIVATGEYNDKGEYVGPADFGTLVAGTVSVAEDSAIQVLDGNKNVTMIGTEEKSPTGAEIPVTVSSTGVISGLLDEQVLTVTDLNAKGEKILPATTYTVDTDTKTITVSGKYAGVYTFASAEAVKAATITSVYGQPDTITSVGAAAEPVALKNKLTLEKITGGKDCYAVVKGTGVDAGFYVIHGADTEDHSYNVADSIGYFKVTKSETGGKTTVKVEFYNNGEKASEGGTKPATLIPAVAVDFTHFQTYDDDDGGNPFTTVDVTGLSAGEVSLVNVPTTAIGDIQGRKTGDAPVDYFPKYELASGATITLPQDAGDASNGTKWTFAVNVSEKVAATGVKTYSIGAATPLVVGDPVGPCFVVTTTVVGDNITYTVTYQPNDVADQLGALDQKCWEKGVTVNATSVAAVTGKEITVEVSNGDPALTGKATYTINAQVGVIVTDVEGKVEGYWANAKPATIAYDDNDPEPEKRQFITLNTTGTPEYWLVKKVNDGNNAITITKVTESVAKDNGNSYIKVVNNAGAVTVSYHGYDSNAQAPAQKETNTPSISLSGLNNNQLKVALKGADGIKSIDITDGGQGTKNCVDYAVTAVAGTEIIGKGSGDSDVSWISRFKNAAVINLDALAAATYKSGETYYYEVTATAATELDKEGYRLVTLASDTPSTEEPAASANYFAVRKDKGGKYTVEYHTGSGDGAIALSAGKATLSVNGNETITSITENVSGAGGDNYLVDKATDSLATLAVDPDPTPVVPLTNTDYVKYLEVSRWTGGDISLVNWNGANNLVYSITKTPAETETPLDAQGVTKYELAAVASNYSGPLGTLTFKYAADDGTITIDFNAGTAGLTAEEIADIVNSINLDATLNPAIKDKVSKIVLTKDSVVSINYAVENLAADITLDNFTEGKDTVKWAEEFVMGTDDTLTLTKGTGKHSVAYYVVTATDGKDTKNIRTVSIAKTPLLTATNDVITKEMGEALTAAGGNYFIVRTDEDGFVTVKYTQKDIDLDKLKVNVDATAVERKDIIGDNLNPPPDTIITDYAVTVDGGDDTIAYTVSGLDVNQTAINVGGATLTMSYNESFAITYDKTAVDDGLNSAIILSDKTSGTDYYEVVRAEGSAVTQGVVTYKVRKAAADAPASGHYFAVKYAETGVTVTYYNADGAAKYNLAEVIGAKPQITVNAKGVAETVTAINITDGGSADTPAVNYALTEVNPDIEIVGQSAGDTVTKTSTAVWAANQTLTLTDNETTYYVLTGTEDANGKVTVTIGTGVTTKPEDNVNYFVVKRTADKDAAGLAAPGKFSYAIESYHPANGGAAYDLTGEKAGTLTIDATKATGGIDLNNDNGASKTAKTHFAVTNLPEVVATPADMVAGDTVSYTTTFTWPTETVPKDDNGNNQTYTYKYLVKAVTRTLGGGDGDCTVALGETVTTAATDAKTEYVVATVTKDSDGVYTISVDAASKKGNGTTGALGTGTLATVKVMSIEAPAATAKINARTVVFADRKEATATDPAVVPSITGVAAESTITVANQDVDIVSAALQANDTVTIIDDDNGTVGDNEDIKKVYTAAGAGTITIRHDTDAFNVESGVLLIGKNDGEVASTVAGAAYKSIAISATGDADGNVVVTFDAKKGITSITGLDADERLTIAEGDGKSYTYERDANGYVVKTQTNDTGNKTYAAMDSSTIDILSLGYSKETAITGVVGTFNWNTPNATFYLEADAASASVAYGTGTGNVISGSIYIQAKFTGGQMEITPMRGNAKGLLDPIPDYAGVITISGDAAGTAINYKKDKNATYTVNVVNAKTGSAFSYLGASDTVTTTTLSENNTITMTASEIVPPATAPSDQVYIYTKIGDAEAFTFTGAALTKGTVAIDNIGNTKIRTSDGSKIVHDDTVANTVDIVVENGAVKSIKGLATDGETITITKDGVKTEYVFHATDGKPQPKLKFVTKTVTDVDGSITITTIADVTETTDVWTATGTNSITEGAFAWGMKDVSGFFLVTDGAATVVAGAGTEHNLTNGDVFVKATITAHDATKNVDTLTLTTMRVVNGVMTEVPSTEVSIQKVTVTADGTILNYNGTGKTYNLVVKNAGADSTFTNLLGGDIVTTTLNADKKISVNGKEWVSTAISTPFKIYSDGPSGSRIVDGKIAVTEKANTVDAATEDGKTTQTFTYTAGEDNKNGVQVTYETGKPRNITDLDLGESVKVEEVGTDGKKVVTEYTTAKGSGDTKTVVYRSRGGVVTVREINNKAEIVDSQDFNPTGASDYQATVTDSKDAFDWTAAAAKKTTVYGYFLASEKGVVEAATSTDKATSDYTQYGRTYLYVSVGSSGSIQLQKCTVGMTGAIGTPTAIVAGDKLDVTLTLPTEGLTISSLTGHDAAKKLTIVNAGAGTSITSWGENDHITTVALKAAVYNADGSVKSKAETLKLGTVTYTAGANGAMEFIGSQAKNGTFQLATGTTTIESAITDETTGMKTVDAVTYAPNGSKDMANVAVTNGRVSGLTGFGDKESVVIVTTVTDKFGMSTSSKVTYTATLIKEGLNAGQFEVTKVMDDGTKYTHVFKDTTQNVLASGVIWNPAGQDVSSSTFNWNNTGYFHATISPVTKDAEKKIYVLDAGKPVDVQTVAPTFKTGDYYLQVKATKALSGLVTITDMSFVQRQSNGTFTAVKAGETLPKFDVIATATGGITFAEGAHPDAALTITPAMGKTYTGLLAGDKIGTTTTAAGQTITVNGQAYKVTNASAFVINGDTTIESGTFTVTETAKASAVPQYGDDTVTKKITYTPGEAANAKGGVVVEFKQGSTYAVVKSGSEIGSIKDLQPGEKVVIESVKGTTDTVYETTTITKADDNTVTKTITGTDFPTGASVVMTQTIAAGAEAATDVMTMTGYQVTNKFDFGETTKGSIGFFKATTVGGKLKATVTTGAPATAFNGTGADKWVLVGVTKDSSNNITINDLQLMTDDGKLSPAKSSLLDGGLTIDASKLAGGITLGENAVKLCTNRTYDEDKKAWVVDDDATKYDTKGREYGIAITGAKAGNAYNGFAATDTIAAGELKADDTITVDGLLYAVKQAAAADAVQFYGNGAAKQGEFKFNGAYKEARGYDAENKKLTTVTGSADATVKFAAGLLTSITEIGVGESVTVVELNTETKATKTTKYVASAGDKTGEIKVTREVTEDGVVTTSYATNKSGDIQNITALTYSDATAVISSNFDWTAEKGSGYFLTEVTMEGSTVKDIGTVDIKAGTKTITPADAGKYVAKVTVTTDGKVDGIALHKVLETGELGDAIKIPAAATGTLNITAPSVKVKVDDKEVVVPLNFDKTGFDKLTVNITDAANGSVISKLAKGDTLTTATLAKVVLDEKGAVKTAAEQVTVNDKVYVAGADGVMKFVDAGVMTDGTIVMSGTLSIETTGELPEKYSDATKLTISHTGADTPVITVKNGVLDGTITGLNGGAVTVSTPTTGTNASAKYEKNSVTVTMSKSKTSLTTLAMAEGDTVKFGTHTLQSGAAGNKLEFVRDTGTDVLAKNGVLRLTAAGQAFTMAGASNEDTKDNVTVQFTTKTTSKGIDVKVTNGEATSIKGLKAGEKLQISDSTKTTEYAIDAATPTKITKTVTEGTKVTEYTAFITEGADILSANYFGEGAEVTEENQIVGQLSWADVSGRATGYFEVKSNKTTIVEQSEKKVVTAGKGKTALWAVANATTAVPDAIADGINRQVLTVDALQVATSSDGKTTTVLGSGAKLLAGSTITVTAPTAVVDGVVPPLFFNKGTGKDAPTYAVVLNKLAANSAVQNLAFGDKATTATLKAATYDKTTGAVLTWADSVKTIEANGTVVTYTAGANGAMTFVGEGDNTKDTDPTSAARLLSGTVILTAGDPIYLAGGADNKDKAYNGDANDLKVTVAGDGNVIAKVANGVISTVTGFDTDGATLVVTKGTGESAENTRYKVVDIDATNKTVTIERIVWTGTLDEDKATKTYRTVKAAADFYAGDQTKTFKAMETAMSTLTEWTTEGTKYAFIRTDEVTTAGTWNFTTTNAKGKGVASDVITEAFSGLPGKQYVRLTAKTAKNGMTTISAVDLMEADASSKTGKLVAVKAVNGVSPVYGVVSINGQTESPAKGETNGKLTFALPAAKNRKWTLNAQNLALGSVITGYTDADKIASGDGTYELSSKAKTVTVYRFGEKVGTSTDAVTYAGKDGATVKVKDGVLSVTGMGTEKEKVTVVTDTDTAGLVTTEYLVLAGGLIQKTVTAADGLKTVCTSKAAAGDKDVISELEYNEVDKTKTTVVSDFNWTLDKSQVGYFAVSGSNAAVKTAKTTIKASDAGKVYIAVALDGAKEDYEGRDGVVASVRAMTFNTTEGKMVEASEGSFSGKITITAPTAALVFDRTTALATENKSIGENAQFVITGAAAGSEISGLKARAAYATCDSVTTAKLTGVVYNADGSVKTAGSQVKVNGFTYTAGANGSLGFTMQQVNGSDDERVTLTSGTISLTYSNPATEGPNAAVVGKNNGIVAGPSSSSTMGSSMITVAATTNKNGVTSYTIGDLGENETFQVLTYGSETVTSTFKKSSSALFFKADGAADDGTEGKYIYALNGKTSVGSSALAISGNVPTAKGWQAVKETFTEGTDGFLTTTYGAVTVDLKTLDSRYKADAKASNGSGTYAYVIDKYLASSAKAAKALNAAVVRAQDTDIQTLIGDVTGATGTWRSYTANTVVGQNIKATANWNVFGSNAADTITGASSGSDLLSGGEGNDSLVGGNAADTFIVGEGRDTIKGFGNGKDTIAGFAFNKWALSGTNVELWTDSTADDTYGSDENGVTLLNMGTKKAVNIGGTNYYFGSGNAKKAETFTFDVSSKEQSAAAKYYGKTGLANTLSVGTDKTKATAKTLGDTLVVDLSDNTRYFNIASADASKSGNRVDLTATAKGSTLKGGTYQSTLRGGEASDMLYGGSGVDVFWAENLSGSDTVKSYQTSKDAVFLGNIDEDPATATEVNDFTIQAVGKNVLLTKGEASMLVENAAASATKAFKLSKDGTSTNTLSYYVGNASAKSNAFVAAMGTDMATKTEKVDEKDVTVVTMSSYYLGSAATNVDTLKLSSKTKNENIGQFNMNTLNRYISTIDVIDTSGLAKGSTIELIGRESGTYTLKGSNNVTEKFNLSALALEGEGVTNNITITNLGVGEIIELAEGVTATKTSGPSTKNTYFKLTDSTDTSKSYGTLCITGVAASKFTSNSYTKSFSRN